MTRRQRQLAAAPSAPAAYGSGWLWLACLIVLFVYLNSLPGIIFWDSEELILNNVFLRSFRFLPRIFTTSVMAGAGQVMNYYRPLPVTLLLCEFQLWGVSPLGYHAVNLLFHLGDTALLYLLVREVCGSGRAAFWTAILFALHPIQNETVNYPDHVEGMMACFFGLASLLLWLRGRPWPSILCWALCLLCKEEGVVFFPIHAGLAWLRPPAEGFSNGEARVRRLLALWPLAVILMVYVALKLTVFNFLHLSVLHYGAQRGTFGGLGLRLLTFAKASVVYARLLLWPTGLHFDRDIRPAALAEAGPWVAALCGPLALGFLWSQAKDLWPARWGLLWFCAGLLPYCGLVPFNNILAEHFLYIPSAGLFLALVLLARRAYLDSGLRAGLPAGAGAAFMAVLLALYALADFRRNRDWQSAIRIYETTLAGNPRSYRAANNLGVEYFRARDMARARDCFEQALRANPAYAPALNNLGAVVDALGRLPEALDWYRRSAAADPEYALAHKNFAGAEFRLGHWPLAQAEAEAALRIHPEYVDALMTLGAAQYSQKRFAESRAAFEKAASLAPAPGVYADLAQVYAAQGDSAKADWARRQATQGRR